MVGSSRPCVSTRRSPGAEVLLSFPPPPLTGRPVHSAAAARHLATPECRSATRSLPDSRSLGRCAWRGAGATSSWHRPPGPHPTHRSRPTRLPSPIARRHNVSLMPTRPCVYHLSEAYGLGRTCVRHSSRSLGGASSTGYSFFFSSSAISSQTGVSGGHSPSGPSCRMINRVSFFCESITVTVASTK